MKRGGRELWVAKPEQKKAKILGISGPPLLVKLGTQKQFKVLEKTYGTGGKRFRGGRHQDSTTYPFEMKKEKRNAAHLCEKKSRVGYGNSRVGRLSLTK